MTTMTGFRRCASMQGRGISLAVSLAAMLLLSPANRGQVVAMAGGQAGKDAPAAVVGGGVVSGHVMFADTDGPARFAKVLLKPTVPNRNNDEMFALIGAGDSGGGKSKLSAEDQAELKKQQAASLKMFAAMADMMISATVAADGSYVFTNVRPGTYFVHAIAPGYIDPLAAFTSDELASTDPAMKQKIAAAVTTITVNGTDEVKADLRLERGASISGRVLYDDGTPAAGWTVKTVHPAAESTGGGLAAMGLDASDLDLSHATESSTTDDTGHFRIAGLATGDYMLEARLIAPVLGHSSFNPTVTNAGSPFSGGMMMGMTGLRLAVYSGDALRRGEAKTIELKAAEERSGYDLTVPLHAMHSVGGMVRSKTDGHPVNGGTVELTAQDANGKDDPSVHLAAAIQPDGTFRFDYVPGPGSYTLKAAHAVDANTVATKQMFGSLISEQKTTRSYGPATIPVTVGDGDVTDLKIDVPDAGK